MSVNVLNKSSLAVTEVRYDYPNYGTTEMAVQQDCFAVTLTLRPHPYHELSVDGRVHAVRGVRTDDIMFYNLSTAAHGYTAYPIHSLFFVLSRQFLDELAEDLDSPRIAGLTERPLTPVSDPVLAYHAMCCRTYIRRRTSASCPRTTTCSATAFTVCANYSNLVARRKDIGCLTRWQVWIAKEMIQANLDGGLGLSELAAACGLRSSQFAHAFRETVGMPPHQWLTKSRVARAKKLLRGDGTLSEIALRCGFADQSHLTRVFRRIVGVPPGYWRSQQ